MHCELCGREATYLARKGDTATGDKHQICGDCLWRDRRKWSVSIVVRGSDSACHSGDMARAAFFEDRERQRVKTSNPVSRHEKATRAKTEARKKDKKAFANVSR